MHLMSYSVTVIGIRFQSIFMSHTQQPALIRGYGNIECTRDAFKRVNNYCLWKNPSEPSDWIDFLLFFFLLPDGTRRIFLFHDTSTNCWIDFFWSYEKFGQANLNLNLNVFVIFLWVLFIQSISWDKIRHSSKLNIIKNIFKASKWMIMNKFVSNGIGSLLEMYIKSNLRTKCFKTYFIQSLWTVCTVYLTSLK